LTDVPPTTITGWPHDGDQLSPRRGRRRLVVPAALALALGAALGTVGWELQEPGGQLLIESLVVAGIGLGISGVAWVVACFVPARGGLWLFAVLGACASLLAAIWTFEFAMPASLSWDGSATQTALSALAAAHRAPKGPDGEPVDPCLSVSAAGVGPLSPPYRVCTTLSTSRRYVVTFFAETASGGVAFPTRGLAFTNLLRPPAGDPFPDECSRRLTGTWWAFEQTVGRSGTCPFGYQFHGGG
jgi:hypothetical protein